MNNNLPFKKEDPFAPTQEDMRQAEEDRLTAERGRVTIIMGCRNQEDREEGTRFCQSCWRYKHHHSRCSEFLEGKAWPGSKSP